MVVFLLNVFHRTQYRHMHKYMKMYNIYCLLDKKIKMLAHFLQENTLKILTFVFLERKSKTEGIYYISMIIMLENIIFLFLFEY